MNRNRRFWFSTVPSLLKRLYSTYSISPSQYALVFPGQGYQHPGMLRELNRTHPSIVSPILEELDQTLGQSLSGALLDEPPAIDINDTSKAQPLILAASYAHYKVAQHERNPYLDPKYVLGHSLGEYTALLCANVISFSHAANLVHQRGLAMIQATKHISDQLSMTALLSTPKNALQVSEAVAELVPKHQNVSIANYNSLTQITLSGSDSEINNIVNQLNSSIRPRVRTRRLNVSGPFHSSYMVPAAQSLEALLMQTVLSWPPSPPRTIISNLTAKPFRSDVEVRQNLVKSMTQPVQWTNSLKFLEENVSSVVSVGPGDIGKLCTGYEFEVKQLLTEHA
jgi:[acyl-carrier-protein] S-malonyltransferase